MTGMLRLAMILGAGALGTAIGYAQGRYDAITENNDRNYKLKHDVNKLTKKAADILSRAKDDLVNSEEFDNFKKSFTRDEMMHLVMNDQLMDTIREMLYQKYGILIHMDKLFTKEDIEKYRECGNIQPQSSPSHQPIDWSKGFPMNTPIPMQGFMNSPYYNPPMSISDMNNYLSKIPSYTPNMAPQQAPPTPHHDCDKDHSHSNCACNTTPRVTETEGSKITVKKNEDK